MEALLKPSRPRDAASEARLSLMLVLTPDALRFPLCRLSTVLPPVKNPNSPSGVGLADGPCWWPVHHRPAAQAGDPLRGGAPTARTVRCPSPGAFERAADHGRPRGLRRRSCS
ncbi:hypothetical protein QJS66_00435 [Kocuria rhizophila]|nr:hypothetical protein QJS66_00435 [Kocuria rhizophila]